MANFKASYSASLSEGGGGKGSETDKMQNRSETTEQATERQRIVKVTADMSFPKSKSH